jgi:hypothetical protein
MSLQKWTADDIILLIEWASVESIEAIKQGRFSDVTAIHQGIAAIVHLGEECFSLDSPANKWLDLQLAEFSCLLRETQYTRSVIKKETTLAKLILMTKFYKSLPDVLLVGQEISLPESFD